MGERLLALLAAGAMVLACIGSGDALLRLLRSRAAGVERAIFAFGLGAGALSIATLAIGAAGLLRPSALFALYLVAAVAGVPGLRALRVAPAVALRDVTFAGWALAGVLAAAVVAALAPATAWDAIVYHLVIPREFLRAGAVVDLPLLFQSKYPLLMEMLWVPGASWAGGAAAQVFHVAVGGFFCLAIYAIARRTVARGSATLAALLAISSPAIFLRLPSAYIDQGLAFFEAAAFLAFLRYRDGSLRSHVLAGALAGLAAGAKIFGPRCAVALVVLTLFLGPTERGPLGRIRDAAVLGAVSLLAFFPWMVKNYVLIGNPLFPLAIGQLGGGETSAEAYRSITQTFLARSWPDRSVADFLLFPVRVSLRQAPEGIVNPALFLLPLGLLLTRRGTIRRHAPHLVYVLVVYATWYLSAPLIRVFQMPLGLLAVCGAAAWEGSRNRVVRFALLALAVLSAGRYLASDLAKQVPAMRAAAGVVSPEAWLRDQIGNHEAVMTANRLLPEDAVVLASDSRVYYLHARFVHLELTRNGRRNLKRIEDPLELATVLDSWEVTHLLLSLPRPDQPMTGALRRLEALGRLVRLAEAGTYVLLEFR